MSEPSGGMSFHSRRSVKPQDLSPNGTLFGGNLLQWIDEECAIFAISQLGSWRVVTKFMSEIDFVSTAHLGELIELGLEATAFGRTSLTLRVEVRNMVTGEPIVTIERIVMICLGADGRPAPHGQTVATHGNERIPKETSAASSRSAYLL
jgi:acyl-CoA thioesterase YciA